MLVPAPAARNLNYTSRREMGLLPVSSLSIFWDGGLLMRENAIAVSMRVWRYWQFEQLDRYLQKAGPARWNDTLAPLPKIEFGPFMRTRRCLLMPWLLTGCE
jgi:hypothetical protein